MENRAPRPARAERAAHRRRPWWPALTLLAVAVLACAWWIGYGPGPLPAAAVAGTEVTGTEAAWDDGARAPLGDDTGGRETVAPDVATIVAGSGQPDQPDTSSADGAAPVAASTAAAPFATAPATPPPAAATPASGNPFAAATPAAHTARAPVPAAASRPIRAVAAGPGTPASAATARGERGDTDLLATLLGNIKHSEQTAQTAQTSERSALKRPRTGSDQEALDLLVRQVRERDAQAATTGKPAGRPSTRAPLAAALLSSEQVQAQLRRCPRANTSAGISCRQKVCAKVAGQDAACPKPQ